MRAAMAKDPREMVDAVNETIRLKREALVSQTKAYETINPSSSSMADISIDLGDLKIKVLSVENSFLLIQTKSAFDLQIFSGEKTTSQTS